MEKISLKTGRISQAELTWQDNSNNETGLKLERSLDGTNFTELAILTANTTSYEDINLTPNTTYYYRICSYNTIGNSNYSNITSITTPNLKYKHPIAIINTDITSGISPLTIQFHGESSYDTDGTIASYRWSFGDGNTSNEINPSHTYNNTTSRTKVYNATLIVTDSQGLSTAKRVKITVGRKKR